MDSYAAAKLVEAEGIRRLDKYLRRHHSTHGRVVWAMHGKLALAIQTQMGDVFVNREFGVIEAVELKAEKKLTGNCCIEIWSNRKRKKQGWLYTNDADWLACYYLDKDELRFCDFNKLKEWLSERYPSGLSRIDTYPLIEQKKYYQLNDTWFRQVPWKEIDRSIGGTVVWPPQLELWEPPLFRSENGDGRKPQL